MSDVILSYFNTLTTISVKSFIYLTVYIEPLHFHEDLKVLGILSTVSAYLLKDS